MSELGVKPNIALRPCLFLSKTEQWVIMWEDFGFGYIHMLEGVPKQHVGRASLVYKDLLEYASYLNTDNHGVILHRSIALKSSFVKVMGDMLGTRCRETMLMDRTC